MAQASNLAQAINKLMQSKLDSSLRERYFVIDQESQPHSEYIGNVTTNSTSNYYIDIGPDDIISITSPYNKKDSTPGSYFEGKISEAINLGYVEGNFIFIDYEPQE